MEAYALTIQLYQQTPILHFQADDYGATLRASEVKPKLDRFIIMQLGGWEEAYKAHPDWFICEDRPALNYKLRIEAPKTGFKAVGSNVIIQNKPGGKRENHNAIPVSYFGNMGDNVESFKKAVFYTDPLKMTVICFVPELMKFIQNGKWNKIENESCPNISRFFYVTNFGTRSNKGFGGFSAVKSPKGANVRAAIKEVLNCQGVNELYYISYSKQEKNKRVITHNYLRANRYSLIKAGYLDPDQIDVTPSTIDINIRDRARGAYLASWQQLTHIANLYQILKTGYNVTKFDAATRCESKQYVRPYIYLYTTDNGTYGNEKAWMKQPVHGDNRKTILPVPNPKLTDSGTTDYRYVRALLGVGTDFLCIGVRDGAYILHAKKRDKQTITIASDELDRVNSPLLFKVIGKTTYILPYEPAGAIFGKEFTIGNESTGVSGKIRTPDYGVLSISELMHGFMEYINTCGARYRGKDATSGNSDYLNKIDFSTIYKDFDQWKTTDTMTKMLRYEIIQCDSWGGDQNG